MRKLLLSFLFVYIFSFSGWASIQSVQELIYASEFMKAKVQLDKVFTKDSTNYQALFLYAQFYFSTENKVYQIDSAFYYVSLSIKHLPLETDKNYLKNLKYGFSKTRIYELKTNIIQEAFFSTEKENNINAYNHFLEVYDDVYFKTLATKHRDDLAFVEAKNKMDFMSFKEFMDKYPSANQAAEARSLYEQLLYENAGKEGNWQGYKYYLDNYPDAIYRKEAMDKYELLLYQEYNKANDPKKLYEFISTYPNNRYRNDSESTLFHLTCKNFNTQTLLNFIKEYPKSNKMNHLWRLIYLNETSSDEDTLYRQFIQQFPFYPQLKEFQNDSSLASLKLYTFEANGLYGFKNKLNDSIVQLPIYYDAQEFSGRLSAVASAPSVNHKSKYGFVNKQFVMIIPQIYDEVYDFEDGLSIVGVGDCPEVQCQYGIINELHDTILPLQYRDIHEFHDRLALVETKEGNIGYVNKAGNFSISPHFKNGRNFSESLAAVQLDTSWFFIDTNGRQAIPLFFKIVTDFKNGLSSFSNDGNLWGVINKTGSIIKEAQFKGPVVFEDNVTKVKVEEKIEKKGKVKYVLIEYLLHLDGSMEKIMN